MKRLGLFLMILLFVAGCGKVANESVSSSSGGTDDPPEFVYFTSTSNPRISYV